VIDERAIDLVKNFEGFSEHPYTCPAGKLTIGYGSTMWTTSNGGRRRIWESFRVTEEQATLQMVADLDDLAIKIQESVVVPINSAQLGALASFAYNVGLPALRGSTLLRKLNSGDYEGAADQLDRWVNAGGQKVRGLATRRAAEKALFLSTS
jgi:lysozyme